MNSTLITFKTEYLAQLFRVTNHLKYSNFNSSNIVKYRVKMNTTITIKYVHVTRKGTLYPQTRINAKDNRYRM